MSERSLHGPKSITSPASHESLRFARYQRLNQKAEFSAVFNDAPVRASHPNILILARFNGLSHPRLGTVVAKKNVKKAHQRNLFKRIARESFRRQQHNLPAIDAIVLARRGADQLSSTELNQTLKGLWHRIKKRAASVDD